MSSRSGQILSPFLGLQSTLGSITFDRLWNEETNRNSFTPDIFQPTGVGKLSAPFRLLFIRFRYPSHWLHHRSRLQTFHFQIHLQIHPHICRPEEASQGLKNAQDNPIDKSNPKPSIIYSIDHIASPEGPSDLLIAFWLRALLFWKLQEMGFIECCQCYIEIIVSHLMWVSKGDQSSLAATSRGVPTGIPKAYKSPWKADGWKMRMGPLSDVANCVWKSLIQVVYSSFSSWFGNSNR